jgi:rsbT co-antagonist protein RsbR
VRRVKRTQSAYFLGLFEGRLDRAYVADRVRVGTAHERIGLGPQWYLGAYRRYLHLLFEMLVAESPHAADAHKAFLAALKLVFFDTSIALDTYIAAQLDAIHRQQIALRELSTPVIRVHARVLLLPLVGTIDSHRAEQIMETCLLRVTEEHARVLILDIAGVAVVDTKVADHLIKTTAAVKLLGAETIVTGISPPIARTMVQLGVDISSIATTNRLDEGIALALGRVGKKITRRGASSKESTEA